MNIVGTASDDLLVGTAANDTIDGLAGSDRLEGSDGDDVLNGGDGNDNSVRNLRDSSGVIRYAQVAGLFGGLGNDTLNGGAGDDFLSPGAGNYVVDGGTELDVLGFDFTTVTTAVAVTYTNSAGTTVGSNTIRNIEMVGISTGSGNDTINVTATVNNATNSAGNLISTGAGNDTISSGTGRDRLLGGDGDDVINGGAGNDSSIMNYTTWEGRAANAQVAGLFGGLGNDTLNGEAGDDFLSPGAGNYVVDGGTELDVLGFDFTTVTTAVAVTYTNSAGTTVGSNTIRNIEMVGISTGSGNDTINVTATVNNATNSAGNLISTGAGNDTISSGTGRDRLLGGDGDDAINGGAGNDSSIMNYTTWEGRAANAQVAGLFGEAGNDTLNGEAGNDFLSPGAGNYVVDGGTELDVLGFDFTTVTTAVAVTYTNSAGTTVGSNTIRNIEMVGISTGSGNDTINVTATVNNATNSAGNLISTGAGNDTISSGTGRDRLLGGDGDDVINGGAGNDSSTMNYTTWEGRAANAQVAGLFGGAGNDTLNGEAGDDWLDGGSGNDVLDGGAGIDRHLYNSNAAFASTAIGIDTIANFLSGTDKILLDKTTFTALTSAAGNGFSVSGEFASVTTDAAAETSTALITYNNSNGKLFYNQNGSASGFGTGAQFATLTGNPLLSAADFIIQT